MGLLLQWVTDAELIRRIDSARESIVLYTPGVDEKVAKALCRAMQRLNGEIKIVLDVSQKSIDMGFLECPAIALIWQGQCELGRQVFFHRAGLRLGFLKVDSDPYFVYAPFARLMEDENKPVVLSCPSGANVWETDESGDLLEITPVDRGQVFRLCVGSFKKGQSLSEIRAGYEEKIAAKDRELVEVRKELERVKEEKEEAVQRYKDKFRLRRIDFTIKAQPMKIDSRRVKIPPMFLVGLETEVVERLSANYPLYPKLEDVEKSLEGWKYEGARIKDFHEEEERIREKYLITVPRFGSFILTEDVDSFAADVEKLKELGRKMGKNILSVIREEIDKNIDKLYDGLTVYWKKSRDPWWGQVQKSLVQAHVLGLEVFSPREYFKEEMHKCIGTDRALEKKFIPGINHHEYPIDEALTKDMKFISALEKALRQRNGRLRESPMEGVKLLWIEDLIAPDVLPLGYKKSEEEGFPPLLFDL